MKTENQKPTTGILLFLCLAGVLCLAGCYGPSAVDQDYGNSVRNNLAQTVLDHQAGLKTTPATGLPPAAGANEMEVYNKSFRGEEKKPTEMKISY